MRATLGCSLMVPLWPAGRAAGPPSGAWDPGPPLFTHPLGLATAPIRDAFPSGWPTGRGHRRPRAARAARALPRSEDRPRDRQPLALPARQLLAALADHRVVAVGQRGHELVGLGQAGGAGEVGVGGVGLAVGEPVAPEGRRSGLDPTVNIAT